MEKLELFFWMKTSCNHYSWMNSQGIFHYFPQQALIGLKSMVICTKFNQFILWVWFIIYVFMYAYILLKKLNALNAMKVIWLTILMNPEERSSLAEDILMSCIKFITYCQSKFLNRGTFDKILGNFDTWFIWHEMNIENWHFSWR